MSAYINKTAAQCGVLDALEILFKYLSVYKTFLQLRVWPSRSHLSFHPSTLTPE